MVPTTSAFDPAVIWGDVSISDDNSTVRVFLKRLKTRSIRVRGGCVTWSHS